MSYFRILADYGFLPEPIKIMKRFLYLLFIVTVASYAQEHPATPVVNAELAFAKTAKDSNTKNAFLKHMADDGVLFARGEAVNGIELWQKRKADSTLLDWWPIWGDISSDGKLAYTTGPWRFFRKRTDSEPVGSGYFSSVWQKQKDGQWKVLVDLGIVLEGNQELPTQVTYPKAKADSKKSKTNIEDVENAYTSMLNAKAISFDEASLASEFRIHRGGVNPVTDKSGLAGLTSADKKYSFEKTGSGVSSGGDFAYSYGKVKITSGADETPGNYMRVWRKFNGEWKIVFDVVTG